MTRAVFLDRDGTIVEDPGYLRDPAMVRLIPGAAAALRQLEELDYLRIVITNQSGIGRGLITAAELEAVNGEIKRQLAADGGSITAWYHCAHLPDAGCECRKPGSLLHRTAAAALDIDLEKSWWIGDRTGDLIPAREFGGRGILVATGEGQHHLDAARDAGFAVVADIGEAVEMISREVRSEK